MSKIHDPEVPLNEKPHEGNKSEAPHVEGKELHHPTKEGYHHHNKGYTKYHGEPLGSATCK